MDTSIRRDAIVVLILGGWAGLSAIRLAQMPAQLDGLWVVAPLLVLAAAWWLVKGAVRWFVAFVLAAWLLPPLPLPWGDSGPHVAIVIAALGVWAGLARLRAWESRLTPVSTALSLLWFVLLASVPLAALYSGASLALASLARVGLLGISIYAFFYLSRGPARDLAPERLVRLLWFSGLVCAALALVDFYFQFPPPARFAEQFVWLSGGVFRRAQGVFYEASTLATLCVFLTVGGATVLSCRMGNRLGISSAWLYLGAAVLLAALIFSFSRASLISLAISLAALAWLERARLRPSLRLGRWLAVLAVCLLAVAALAYRLLPDLMLAWAQRVWYSGEFFFSEPNLILSRRLESWTLLVDYLRQHPLESIFGIGYKTLPYTEFLGRPVVADNMYLSLLIETGWLGLVALLLVNITILAASYRQATRPPSDPQRWLGVWMFCFWCGLTVQMATGDLLTYWRILPGFLAVLAVLDR